MVEKIKTGLVRINRDLPGVYVRGDEAYLFAAALKHILDQFDLKDTPVDNQVFWYCHEIYTLLARSDLSHREFNTFDIQVIVTSNDEEKKEI